MFTHEIGLFFMKQIFFKQEKEASFKKFYGYMTSIAEIIFALPSYVLRSLKQLRFRFKFTLG